MTVIFVIDIFTDSDIQLHLLYVFPLTMISLHCEKPVIVIGAIICSLLFQGYTLLTYSNFSLFTKSIIVLFVFPSNILIAHLGRIARIDHLALIDAASHDGLTGLNNRSSIETIIEREVDRQKCYVGIFAFALLDLDGFKVLNDSKGHTAGDDALIIVAKVLNSHTRQSDITARLGGDEFVILMPHTSADAATAVCQQLCLKIKSSMDEINYPITASIGCATFTQPPVSSLTVFNMADKAMYSAKANGKGRVVSV